MNVLKDMYVDKTKMSAAKRSTAQSSTKEPFLLYLR